MSNPIVVLQHAPIEGPGRIASAIEAAGMVHDPVLMCAGQVPARPIEEASGLVVLGGPMGVYEANAHPYLREEMRSIETALGRGIPVLGVCLGSQLLAHVLGARVYPSGIQEIGW